MPYLETAGVGDVMMLSGTESEQAGTTVYSKAFARPQLRRGQRS